ncbi:MAG: cytochrome C oxidase subunit IV family protein [Flavobacteriales bacterium]|nr:cytochrome C oxidase subunit IV family protein [Flavobacteriales bacterium]
MSDFDRTAEYAHSHSEEDGIGLRKHIWKIFWVLLAITGAEVTLGLFWKDWSLAWAFVKWTFIILTLIKAYFIVADYMHLKHEYKNFKLMVAVPYIVLVIYLIIMVLAEAVFVHDSHNLM